FRTRVPPSCCSMSRCRRCRAATWRKPSACASWTAPRSFSTSLPAGHEATKQVELAQLEYLLPRLTRMWTHLSRIRGGIGLRGPGETQLETDRRAIRKKIATLRRRLEDVADHRANQRQGRRDMPSAALVGYTNAGKSSILRALSGDDVFVEDRLFATLDTLTRE